VSVLYNESFGALQSVATLGLYSLLFLTGLESELDELMAVGKQAFSVAVVGVVLPFALGTLGLMSLFHVDAIPAIFAGASMTATSIGITASVFGELGYLRTREGQIVIGAAVLDDILGIVILAVVVSLGAGGSLDIAPIIQLVSLRCCSLLWRLGAQPQGSASLRLGDRSAQCPRRQIGGLLFVVGRSAALQPQPLV